MSRREQGSSAGDPFGFDDDGMDRAPPLASPLDWAKLWAGAVRRRWALALSVFLPVMVAAAVYYRVTPPLYRVQAKVLAQRSPSLLSGGGMVGDDLPSRSAWDLVHRRDNLVALAQHAGLLESEAVQTGRGLLPRLLDFLRPPEVERKEEPIDAIVRSLDKRLVVTTEDGTIEFRLDWPDARHAYQLVQAAVQSFLEARHLQEVTSMDDVIAQMEGRTAKLKADLDVALAAASRRGPASARGSGVRERQPSQELVRLRSLVEAKARAARDVEEFRSRRVAELESQLTQARTTLSEAHPTVVSLQRDLEALSHESPQLRVLRDEESKVRAEYAARLAKEGIRSDGAVSAEPLVIDTGAQREEDPRVRDLRLQYEQMAARVTSARVDLDAARAAFRYRYNVVWPPEIPIDPYSPKPLKVFGIGFLMALALGLLSAVLPDLLSRRIVERWQIERELNLTVLGETPPSRSSR
jgi:hypothetical protein